MHAPNDPTPATAPQNVPSAPFGPADAAFLPRTGRGRYAEALLFLWCIHSAQYTTLCGFLSHLVEVVLPMRRSAAHFSLAVLLRTLSLQNALTGTLLWTTTAALMTASSAHAQVKVQRITVAEQTDFSVHIRLQANAAPTFQVFRMNGSYVLYAIELPGTNLEGCALDIPTDGTLFAGAHLAPPDASNSAPRLFMLFSDEVDFSPQAVSAGGDDSEDQLLLTFRPMAVVSAVQQAQANGGRPQIDWAQLAKTLTEKRASLRGTNVAELQQKTLTDADRRLQEAMEAERLRRLNQDADAERARIARLAKIEEDKKKKEEAAQKAEAARLAKIEEDKRKKEEDKRKKEEAAQKAEAARLAKIEEDKRKKEEAEKARIAKLEEDKRKKEEAAQKAEAARLAKLEEDKKKKEEAAQKAEAARLAKIEEEKRKKEEAEELARIAKLDAAERKKAEAERAEKLRLAKIEEDKKKKEEAEAARLAKIEEDKKKKEEAEKARIAKLEEDKRKKEEAEAARLAKIEEDKKKKEEAEKARIAKLEEDKRKKEEAEKARIAKLEEDKRLKAEATKKAEEELWARRILEAKIRREEQERLGIDVPDAAGANKNTGGTMRVAGQSKPKVVAANTTTTADAAGATGTAGKGISKGKSPQGVFGIVGPSNAGGNVGFGGKTNAAGNATTGAGFGGQGAGNPAGGTPDTAAVVEVDHILERITIERYGTLGARLGVRVGPPGAYSLEKRSKNVVVLTLVNTKAKNNELMRPLDARRLGGMILGTSVVQNGANLEIRIETLDLPDVDAEISEPMLWINVNP